jgi:hypothetical protein
MSGVQRLNCTVPGNPFIRDSVSVRVTDESISQVRVHQSCIIEAYWTAEAAFNLHRQIVY